MIGFLEKAAEILSKNEKCKTLEFKVNSSVFFFKEPLLSTLFDTFLTRIQQLDKLSLDFSDISSQNLLDLAKVSKIKSLKEYDLKIPGGSFDTFHEGGAQKNIEDFFGVLA